MKELFILGALGSIGTQTLSVVRENKDLFYVKGMSVGRNLELAQSVIDEFKPSIVCFRHESDINQIKYNGIKVFGDEGLLEVAKYESTNNPVFVNALVGASGLKPTITAIKSKKDIALANKETLVMAGDIINDLVKEYNVKLYPIDSEHSAIWSCLVGEDINSVSNLIITSSGGSFRDLKREDLKNVTVSDALKHPSWSMGPKITIDSATMMNKGFEVIEAHHLFHMPFNKIKTILHRESIVHSLVEFDDASVKALLAMPDMRMPILYALSYPNHIKSNFKALDLASVSTLHFETLSEMRYPMLKYAYQAGEKGGLYPVALNASNEVAVKLFLDGKISFLKIEEIVFEYISKSYNLNPSIDEIIKLNDDIQKEIFEKYGVR